MRYAEAIARADIDYILGPEQPLPSSDHGYWKVWERMAVAVITLADEEYRTPAPGDNRAQIPAHLLALLPAREYLSTACETAVDLAGAVDHHPEHADELRGWSAHLHHWCRLNHKFTGTRCSCTHCSHMQKEPT